MDSDHLIIHTDGGSRGNPGPAACAFVAFVNNEIVFKGSKHLGKATNNVAEYQGVVLGLEWLTPEVGQTLTVPNSVTFVLDSELVVKQINGLYKVKDENLQKLFTEVKNLINKTGKKIIFKNVPREQNKDADLLVNQELDRQTL